MDKFRSRPMDLTTWLSRDHATGIDPLVRSLKHATKNAHQATIQRAQPPERRGVPSLGAASVSPSWFDASLRSTIFKASAKGTGTRKRRPKQSGSGSESYSSSSESDGGGNRRSKKKKNRCWKGYKPTPGVKAYAEGSCQKA